MSHWFSVQFPIDYEVRHSLRQALCSVIERPEFTAGVSLYFPVMRQKPNLFFFCIVLCFRREVGEICVLLCCDTACSGNSLPTFQDNLEDGTDRLSRNVGKELSMYTE
jgi:hypothetical protein